MSLSLVMSAPTKPSDKIRYTNQHMKVKGL
jgi:hypothetical protein